MKNILLAIFVLHSLLVSAQKYNTYQSFLVPPTKEEIDSSALKIKIPNNISIPKEWITLLNPAYEEFWSEGNHRPDAGFVLLARNPTVDNAKLWLIRMESKARYLTLILDVVQKAQSELIEKGIINDRYGDLQAAKNLPQVNRTKLPDPKNKLGELNYFFLFSSDCPHCHALAETIKFLPNLQPLQVNQGNLTNFKGLQPSEMASDETKSAYISDGKVPVLVIHDEKTKTVNILRGNKTKEEIILSIATLLAERKK